MMRKVIGFHRDDDGKTHSLDLSCGHAKAMSGVEIDRLAESVARDHRLGASLTTDCKLCDTISLPQKPDKFPKMKPIPIAAAKRIADDYGYDQVVIYGRRCHDSPEPHGEHLTTYGRTKEHCKVAGQTANSLKSFMGWQTEKEQYVEREAKRAYINSLTDEPAYLLCLSSWHELSEEEREKWRAEPRADWEAD